MNEHFKAPWDWKLISITGILLSIFGGLLIIQPGPIPTIILWSIILGTAVLGVYGYNIEEREVKILRLGWSTTISIQSIAHVEVSPNVMNGSIRAFGIGGLFGYIGYFRNSLLGTYKAYATNGKNTVLIETSDKKKMVVSPDNPEKFVASLHQQISKIHIN